MNPTEYTYLLNHPEAVNERQTDALEKIVTEFPYFQSARALRLKGLYNQNSFQYNYALKVTAAYTTDRSVLFEFITSDSFITIQKGLYEQKLAEIEGITVKDSFLVGDDKMQDRPTDTELAKQSILTSIREAENRVEPETAETVDEKPIEQINAEDFGPITEEPQFLPEAIAPVEFTHIETETVAEETDEVIAEPMAVIENVIASAEPELIAEETIDEETVVETPIETIESAVETGTVETIDTDQTQPATQEAELIETKLEIGKPLAFSKDETHSFAEWLQLTAVKPILRDENPVAEPEMPIETNELETKEKFSKDALIDRFIESNPKMPKPTQEIPSVTIEQKEDTSALMTETLARVYLEQRKYQKAIQAYEILILKYPEKSSFFADRISEIKNLQQNNIL